MEVWDARTAKRVTGFDVPINSDDGDAVTCMDSYSRQGGFLYIGTQRGFVMIYTASDVLSTPMNKFPTLWLFSAYRESPVTAIAARRAAISPRRFRWPG